MPISEGQQDSEKTRRSGNLEAPALAPHPDDQTISITPDRVERLGFGFMET
jgi:hypothetical protein